METKKMTVRVPAVLLERAKQYAAEHDTTLTRLITVYLDNLTLRNDPLADAPIVQRLVGSLSSDVTVDDYGDFLAEKYEQPTKRSD